MSIPMNRPCYPHVVGVFYPHPDEWIAGEGAPGTTRGSEVDLSPRWIWATEFGISSVSAFCKTWLWKRIPRETGRLIYHLMALSKGNMMTNHLDLGGTCIFRQTNYCDSPRRFSNWSESCIWNSNFEYSKIDVEGTSTSFSYHKWGHMLGLDTSFSCTFSNDITGIFRCDLWYLPSPLSRRRTDLEMIEWRTSSSLGLIIKIVVSLSSINFYPIFWDLNPSIIIFSITKPYYLFISYIVMSRLGSEFLSEGRSHDDRRMPSGTNSATRIRSPDALRVTLWWLKVGNWKTTFLKICLGNTSWIIYELAMA